MHWRGSRRPAWEETRHREALSPIGSPVRPNGNNPLHAETVSYRVWGSLVFSVLVHWLAGNADRI
jgi:hypothetical protein